MVIGFFVIKHQMKVRYKNVFVFLDGMGNESKLHLEFIVFHSSNIDEMRKFYETLLDVQFVEEQHGSSPVHYSCRIDGLLLELYPSNQIHQDSFTDATLGFSVPNLENMVERLKDYVVKPLKQQSKMRIARLKDPDCRRVILYGK